MWDDKIFSQVKNNKTLLFSLQQIFFSMTSAFSESTSDFKTSLTSLQLSKQKHLTHVGTKFVN